MNFTEIDSLLKRNSQEQLLTYYNELSQSEKDILLSQISRINWSLAKLAVDKSEAKRGRIEPLGALEADEIEKNRARYEQVGIEAIKACKTGAVLLAGGQGTRLGSDKPKGMYNIGITHDFYIFESLFNNLMKVVKKADAWIPLYIMTSDKNDADTRAFLKEKNYFGYNSDYIKFFVQGMNPAVDLNGKFILEEKGLVSMSPNGNGGWFESMKNASLLNDINSRGLEWLTVFAVDNVLQQINDPCFIGAVINSGCVSGAKVVRKASPDERVGVLCLEDGKPSIVEYYEMTDEMRTWRDENGALMYNFGVILNYMFRIDKLMNTLGSDMPLHMAKKKIPYIDKNGNKVIPDEPNGYKFETLVLDQVHMMDNCLSFEVVREKEFAPIKNLTGIDSVESARELLKLNGVVL